LHRSVAKRFSNGFGKKICKKIAKILQQIFATLITKINIIDIILVYIDSLTRIIG